MFTVFFQMSALLIMIGAGCLVTKLGLLDAHTNGQISKMIVVLFNPMLVLASAAGAVGNISLRTMGQVAGIAAAMFAFFILVGAVLALLFDRDAMQRRLFQLMFVFSNLGFIGIPVVSSVLGPEYVVYVTEFLLVYSLVFYTYGITVMEGRFNAGSLKAMVNPGNICSVLGLLLIIFGIRLPDFLMTSVTYLGNVTSPMALVSVGYTLAHADLRQIFGDARLYLFSLIKLLVLPLAMLPLLRLATDDVQLIAVSMVMFGMPVGNMPLMLGTQKGIDCTTCTAAILMTTILCVFTVPLLLMAAM